MSEFLDFNRFLKRIIQILPYIKVSLGMLIASMIFGTILGIIVALININRAALTFDLAARFSAVLPDNADERLRVLRVDLLGARDKILLAIARLVRA